MSFLFFRTDDTAATFTPVASATAEREGYLLEEGEYLVESWNGLRTIAAPTGRTRKVWGYSCPTFTRFEVATIVRDGVIFGAKADRLPGTVAARPDLIGPV